MLLHLRNMHEADVDAVYAIESAVHLTPWSRDVLHDCVIVGYDCRVLEKIQGDEQTIIGYSICRYSLDSCHILNLCIAKPMQHKGYGKIMLSSLLRSLAKPNIHTVSLEVRPSNKAALKLYQHCGFEKGDVKKDYYHDSHGKEDAWVLVKHLNSAHPA